LSGGALDTARAEQFFHDLVAAGKPAEGGTLRLYGETVDILCRRGHHAIAVELERIATKLFDREARLVILCGYAIAAFAREPQRLRVVCQSHDHVLTDNSADPDLMKDNGRAAVPAAPADSVPVYLIDDDPSLRRSLGRLLAVSGFAVSMFETAEAFLAAVDGLKPGCLVIDIQMPGLSGLELMEHLNGRGIAWPRLAMSGSHSEAAEREALRLGARLFLHKPFEPQVLLDAISAAGSGIPK
jgi:CheY-like chemotaxis protein